MIAAWMLYTTAVTLLLWLAAAAAEYLVRALGGPTRFVWGAAMAAALGLSAQAMIREARPSVAPSNVRIAVDALKQLKDAGVVAAHDVPPRVRDRIAVVAPPDRLHSMLNNRRTVAHAVNDAAPRLDASRFERWNRSTAVLWLVGSCLMVLWLVGSLGRLWLIERALPAEIVDGEAVLLSTDFGPALVGVVEPRIVLPRWVLSLPWAERRVILAHEREHASALDPVFLLLATLGLVAQPWNLALWGMLARLRLAVETDCDQRVIASTTDAQRYGHLLIDVYQRSTTGRIVGLAFVKRPSRIEVRIRRMMRRPRVWSVGSGLATAGTLVLTTAAWGVAAPERASTVAATAVRHTAPHDFAVLPAVTVQVAAFGTRHLPVVVTPGAIELPPVLAELPHAVSHVELPSVTPQAGASNSAPMPAARTGPCTFDGVTIPGTSSGTRIRVRGQSSVSPSNDPIIYVDGIRAATADTLCASYGDMKIIMLDSVNLFAAWRDTSEAPSSRVAFQILTLQPGALPLSFDWSTGAGRTFKVHGALYIGSPNSGERSLVIGGRPAEVQQYFPNGRLIAPTRWMMASAGAPSWDVLRRLSPDARCTVPITDSPYVTANGVEYKGPTPAPPRPVGHACFVVDGRQVFIP